MPHEFPEVELEAIAADCDQAARDWFGEGKNQQKAQIAVKWRKKAETIRQAIDAYREATRQARRSRSALVASLVGEVVQKLDSNRSEPVARPSAVPKPTLPVVDRFDAKAKAVGE